MKYNSIIAYHLWPGEFYLWTIKKLLKISETVMNWFDLLLLFLFVSFFFFFKEKHLNFPYGAKIGGIQIAFNRLDLDVYKDGDTPQEKN